MAYPIDLIKVGRSINPQTYSTEKLVMEKNNKCDEIEAKSKNTSKGTLFKAVSIGIAVGIFFMATAKFVNKVMN